MSESDTAKLISLVGQLQHCPPSSDQSAQSCEFLAARFTQFVKTIEPVEDSDAGTDWRRQVEDPLATDFGLQVTQFSTSEVKLLKSACDLLRLNVKANDGFSNKAENGFRCAHWMPEYGCVIQIQVASAFYVDMRLVYPDSWKRVVHVLPSENAVHAAVPETTSVISCPTIDISLLDKFYKAFWSELAKAQTRHKSERSAATNTIGHQKTPQFIASLVTRAMEPLLGRTGGYSGPRGGTTDVGLHTGGQARGTCWALVWAAVKQSLPGYGALFDKVMLTFELHLLVDAVDRIRSLGCTPTSGMWNLMEDATGMLERVAVKGVSLFDDGYSVQLLLERCDHIRSTLDDAKRRLCRGIADEWHLHTGIELKQAAEAYKQMKLDNLGYQKINLTSPNLEELRARQLPMLEFATLCDGSTCTGQELLGWVGAIASDPCSETTHILQVLRTIERYMFTQARRLCDGSGLLKDSFAEDLLKLVNYHISYFTKWTTNRKLSVDSIEFVKQKSRHVLVLWIAFALTHQQVAQTWAFTADYSVALKYKDLEHLVLRDNEAVTALRDVASYLRLWTNGRNPIFHLTHLHGTLDFGERVAATDPEYNRLCLKVKQDIETCVKQNWKRVLEKKAKVERLKVHLGAAEDELLDARYRYQHEQELLSDRRYAHPRRRYSTGPLDDARSNLHAVEANISRIKKSIRIAREMPTFITSPLPSLQTQESQVLFCIHMPRQIELLGQLCMLSQQALAMSCDIEGVDGLNWRNHFNAYSSYSVEMNSFMTVSPNLKVPNHYGPSSVEEVHKLDDIANRCVWYPCARGVRLKWADRDGTFVNPFTTKRESSVAYFTSRMPKRYEKLQWAVDAPGGDSRGNYPYANFDLIPNEDFDRQSFIAMGSLRAFPNQQMRKICAVVKENKLPWAHPAVKIVIQQAVYHVGELSDEERPALVWKSDMTKHHGYEVLLQALKSTTENLSNTPRHFTSVGLLSELTGWLSQYDEGAIPIVREYVAMCRKWATNCRTECDAKKSYKASEVAELRAMECVLYAYAILSMSVGEPDADCSREICELIVLFHNAKLFSGNTPHWGAIQMMETEIEEMMARDCVHILSSVNQKSLWDIMVSQLDRRRSQFLTSLVELVSSSVTKGLSWTLVQSTDNAETGSSSCFEAYDASSETHYALNVLNGIVLTDGAEPGGVPSFIRKMAQFQELFGDRDFEVSRNKDTYTSVRRIGRRYYKIASVEGSLWIEESTVGDFSSNTLQLCKTEWREKLKRVYPSRLHEMYSHWYSVDEDCVILRPKSAIDRSIYYVIQFGINGESFCYEVPRAETDWSLDKIMKRLQDYDALVRDEKNVCCALKKFESRELIHFMLTPTKSHKIHLPRYNLSFELSEHNRLESMNMRGYYLDTQQQLADCFPRFQRYLVLRPVDTGNKNCPQLRIVVPSGILYGEVPNMVDVKLPTACDKQLDYVVYDEHPRLKTFVAETICARLQLAALYASSGSSLPDDRLQMTGAEAALQTLRACRSSRPYSSTEEALLKNVVKYGYTEPTIPIFVEHLLGKANRNRFLFEMPSDGQAKQSYIDQKDQYHAMCASTPARNWLRHRFSLQEEKNILGHVVTSRNASLHGKMAAMEISSPPIDQTVVKEVEQELSKLVHLQINNESKEFPLSKSAQSQMGHEMQEELVESWSARQSHGQMEISTKLPDILKLVQEYLNKVHLLRKTMEEYLHQAVNQARSSDRDRLLATANYVPKLTVVDIVRSSFNMSTLVRLAPRLSHSSRQGFQKAALIFMELCVLEDKLNRLAYRGQHLQSVSLQHLIDDLHCVREWDSREHRLWLVFEVEGCIQIRHEQYVIAKHLIDNRGAICQLNMGRGKTRVILPMLLLYFSQHQPDQIVRTHFLTPLLSETRHYMHRYLTATTAGLAFFEQPFHRGLDISLYYLKIMQETIEDAKSNKGFMMVAPEHRLSLELKRLVYVNAHDDESRAIVATIDEILRSDQYIDILDESDALLHHKYHLVYAMGDPIPLANGTDRWTAAQALLRVLVSNTSVRTAKLLAQKNACCVISEYSDRLGAYSGLRLNIKTKSDVEWSKKFECALAEDLIDSAPSDLLWLDSFGKNDNETKSKLVNAITDASQSLQDLLGDSLIKSLSNFMDSLRALRGLVAYGILEHCLLKRHRVEYGLPVRGSRKKRLAVPFRAADLPSDRSEFSHPDVSILLTQLSYYQSGLEDREVISIFRTILRLDVSSQKYHYDKWFDSVKDRLKQETFDTLRSVGFISLNDRSQRELIIATYRYSMPVINAFLNYHVFPTDTTQYPQRLSRTAWNLAAGEQVTGFSGTKDNHRLLPLSVKQYEPNEQSLRGTDGKMLGLILKENRGFEVICSGMANCIVWQKVVTLALKQTLSAIIDTGALLAGVPLHNVAAFLIERDNFNFKGVTYFDTRSGYDCWVVLEKERNFLSRLSDSAIQERDTFVIFDDARSRGADMKLKVDASALQTLGPEITKDKLMQGAGRLRQLGCHQQLHFAALDEVVESVRKHGNKARTKEVTTSDILGWVMANTTSEAEHGLLEWASNGIHFNQATTSPSSELVEDDWSLALHYDNPNRSELIDNLISAHVTKTYPQISSQDRSLLPNTVRGIVERSYTYGMDREVVVGSHSNEQETELEIEQEEEKEAEVSLPSVQSCQHVAWNYRAALQATSLAEFKGLVNIQKLGEFLVQRIGIKLGKGIQWDQAGIYCTQNFRQTVVENQSIIHKSATDKGLYEYLRIADTMISLRDGTLVLLDDQEADAILGHMWNSPAKSQIRFLNTTLASDVTKHTYRPQFMASIPLSIGNTDIGHMPLGTLCLTACELYNGLTWYSPDANEDLWFLLRQLQASEDTMQDFVRSRGNSHKWQRSDLHVVCKKVDLDTAKSTEMEVKE